MADNLGAIRLYQRCGFVHEGRKRDAVMRHRGFVDLLVMRRLR
jgi:RimJ/RimL family protein N-acetyltransferase